MITRERRPSTQVNFNNLYSIEQGENGGMLNTMKTQKSMIGPP